MTLKEELQRIIDNKSLAFGFGQVHICNHIYLKENKKQFLGFFEKSKEYAKKYHSNKIDSFSGWWYGTEIQYKYILKEKYRFIKDVISILEKEEQQNG